MSFAPTRAAKMACQRLICAQSATCSDRVEPCLMPCLPYILTAVSDKTSRETREAAAATGPALMKIANPQEVKNV